MTLVGDGRSLRVDDVTGRTIAPFAPSGAAGVLFFVQSDCPVSNTYAPEIQHVCREYGTRGVSCALVYEDLEIGSARSHLNDIVRRHVREYGLTGIPAAADRTRAIAKEARATTTPQSIVVDPTGSIRYRGRIDNFYAALGKPRQRATEHDLRDALDAILAGRPVPHAETQPIGCLIVDPASLEVR
jgi:hypothetical protein